jgi:thiol-disulfide isomerase/thioredoxin
MKSGTRSIPALLVIATLATAGTGCDRATAPVHGPPATTTPGVVAEVAREAAPDAIAWHTGDVDAAFALAAEQDKPLFLYWGAAWCPPCNQIKATIFSRPEFVQKSRLFVPVYLDGDTQRAQKLGERFGVLGYPTMIVFNSAGEEITRIPGGLDIGLYGEVLDLTLQDIRPVADVIDALMAGQTLSEDDFRLLAFYSWEQDNERALADRDKVEVFRRMADACPPELAAASARLYVAYLNASIAALTEAAEDEDAQASLDYAQKVIAVERVAAILRDDQLSRANVYMLLYDARPILAATTAPGSVERKAMLELWNTRLDTLADDPSYSIAHRLATTMTRMDFARIDDEKAPIPEALRQQARERVAWADGEARTPYQRQAVINTAWYVLSDAGLYDDARTLLTAELEKSRQPYYFMSDLAELEREAGNTAAALDWLRRAYEASEGPATRFQWGYGYVSGLIEMAPEDADRIAAVTDQVLSELDGQPDAIHGRTGRILNRLSERLKEWNEDGRYDAQIAMIQARVEGLCASLADDETSLVTCRAVLEEA